MKNKIGVVGYFAEGISKAGGQEAKTCFFTQAIENVFPEEKVMRVDTLNWKKKPFKLFFQSIKLARNCKNVIILPAQNGVRIFVPFFLLLRCFLNFRLDYVVVGGWLPEMIKKHAFLSFIAKKLNGIYVESDIMKKSLENQGFNNVYVLPNFKFLTPVEKDEIESVCSQPYKLCTFSRIMKEKGIEDAINAVKTFNEKQGTTVFQLDIYGKIDDGYRERFKNLEAGFMPYIKYCGEVKPDESVDVLKNYFALLFPTYYEGEGFAGTILDAFFSGLPVIATNWRYNSEIIKDNYTGYVYDYRDENGLITILENIFKNPVKIKEMRYNCIEETKKYSPENAIKVVVENLC